MRKKVFNFSFKGKINIFHVPDTCAKNAILGFHLEVSHSKYKRSDNYIVLVFSSLESRDREGKNDNFISDDWCRHHDVVNVYIGTATKW